MAGAEIEHVDVLIVGAGLSGIGAACRLQTECPGQSFVLLEARAESGGTWDLFRYPGVRSDSDMFTLAYPFSPWPETKTIGDGPSILRYLRQTAHDRGIEDKIRYHHRVRRAAWSSVAGRWTVDVERTDTGGVAQFTCRFLYANTGYYRYDEGYTPAFAGRERYTGQIVHPQHWPADLDYRGKRVVVIGSGATAVTLVPALTDEAGHVTMLQRSPSYIAALPNRENIDDAFRRRLPPKAAGRMIRWKNVLLGWLIFQLSRHAPDFIRKVLRRGAESQLPEGYDIDTHFTPRYQPWDQRLCLAPDGDIFTAIREGKASVVTDRITTFTETGLLLESGATLEADVIITATGLNVLMLGGMEIEVDGRAVDPCQTVTHRSVLLCGIPNLAFTFGYTNASWTLKSDLAALYVCRLLNHMEAHGYDFLTPLGPNSSEPTKPYLDLTSGYVERGVNAFPQQGMRAPWRVRHNYPLDVLMFRYGNVGEQIEFSKVPAPREAPRPAVVG